MPFVLYLACGLFPGLALQEAIQRSATALVDNPTLVKRVIFPVEVLPVELACGAAVHQLIATALLLVLMAAMGFPPRPSLVLLPFLLSSSSGCDRHRLGGRGAAWPAIRRRRSACSCRSGSTSRPSSIRSTSPPFLQPVLA